MTILPGAMRLTVGAAFVSTINASGNNSDVVSMSSISSMPLRLPPLPPAISASRKNSLTSRQWSQPQRDHNKDDDVDSQKHLFPSSKASSSSLFPPTMIVGEDDEELSKRRAELKNPALKTAGKKSSGRRLTEAVSEHESEISVYVYDNIPQLDYSEVVDCYRDARDGLAPWQDERHDMAQDMGEIWLHRAFISHPWRVFDPLEADLFYVPMYPVLSRQLESLGEHNLTQRNVTSCGGLTFVERTDNAVTYLTRESQFFNRFGGADHMVACAWWNCKEAFTSWQRMLLRRTILGINERTMRWSWWGCGIGRVVAIPYAASSVLTTPDRIFGGPPEERDITFFFAGSGRNRPERKNLLATFQVVKDLAENSVIITGRNARKWGINSTDYADYISRSRFCFCPRGDTPTSRRFFDAVAAGCIPVVTENEYLALPFAESGAVNISSFSVIGDFRAFETPDRVAELAREILSRSDEYVAALQRELKVGARNLVYGITSGGDASEMFPFLEVATNFLRQSYALARGARGGTGEDGYSTGTDADFNMWSCPEPCAPPEADVHVLPRTMEELPPTSEHMTWLRESETIVSKERSLLFCAPPHTGSLQFRMLAKRMQDVPHWSVSNDRELLFDRYASELELLDITDGPLMEKIYRDNNSGWIKIGVVRDPVTRLLSAYLGLVRAWRAGMTKEHQRHLLQKQEEENEEEEARSEAGQNRGWKEMLGGDIAAGGSGAEGIERQLQEVSFDVTLGSVLNGPGGWDGPSSPLASKWTDAERQVYEDQDAVKIPTFAEVITALMTETKNAPPAFQPVANLCGQRWSPFDSIIPFERLQETSKEVIMSLPGDLWEKFGRSGWGPDGEHAFMDFNYGGTPWSRRSVADEEGDFEDGDTHQELPPYASELFAEDSCAWTEFYPDVETLEAVRSIYKVDYDMYGWYRLDSWEKRLEECART